jgi:hypothetical protein
MSPDLISLAQPGGLEGGNSQAPENQARFHYLWIDVGGIIGGPPVEEKTLPTILDRAG